MLLSGANVFALKLLSGTLRDLCEFQRTFNACVSEEEEREGERDEMKMKERAAAVQGL